MNGFPRPGMTLSPFACRIARSGAMILMMVFLLINLLAKLEDVAIWRCILIDSEN